MLPRQKAREIVFQILYSQGFTPSDADELIPFLMDHFKTTRKSCFAALEEAHAIGQKGALIDAMIVKGLKDYTIDRVGSVELALLRVLVFELVIQKSIDLGVAVAEADRLARKFSHEAAGQFVVAMIHEVVKGCSNEDVN